MRWSLYYDTWAISFLQPLVSSLPILLLIVMKPWLLQTYQWHSGKDQTSIWLKKYICFLSNDEFAQLQLLIVIVTKWIESAYKILEYRYKTLIIHFVHHGMIKTAEKLSSPYE